jgi:hypothetical protein
VSLHPTAQKFGRQACCFNGYRGRGAGWQDKRRGFRKNGQGRDSGDGNRRHAGDALTTIHHGANSIRNAAAMNHKIGGASRVNFIEAPARRSIVRPLPAFSICVGDGSPKGGDA